MFKRLHIDFAKKGWRATNKHDEFPQMTCWLSRQENIHSFNRELSSILNQYSLLATASAATTPSSSATGTPASSSKHPILLPKVPMSPNKSLCRTSKFETCGVGSPLQNGMITINWYKGSTSVLDEIPVPILDYLSVIKSFSMQHVKWVGKKCARKIRDFLPGYISDNDPDKPPAPNIPSTAVAQPGAKFLPVFDAYGNIIGSQLISATTQPINTGITQQPGSLMANPLVYTGGLLDTELAAINVWVRTRFPKSAEMDHLKMLHNSIAHARTLLVAHKFHSELAEVAANADNLHLKAWERLTEWTGLTADGKAKKARGADVNFEAIALLDKVMFDESVNAGMAGNHQWGLDVGPHELAWSPNMSGPSVTNAPLRDGDNEIELAKGANYDYAAELQEEERRKAKNPPPPLLKQARPQPKLRKRVFDEDFA
ncbi:hypothetical protein BDP27DRAFT_1434474 [Rhodocollybia butyracea]|uniref:Uncharacterized protein n=1 Tax=Rhodocollybia butyracea TaxID=206335 RepID=A0A9P5TVQ7_9AGAR|nr:hypothetical protein BDP27DRAFT_1434474 [Rhodocollybia butyracea]